MPTIKKMPKKRKPKRPKKTGSLRDRILNPIEIKKGIKINVYGQGKTGKTTLAADFKKPILIIGTEDGTKSISGVKGVKFFRLEKSEELDGLIPIIQKDFATVALDTGGGLQDLIMKEVLELDTIPVQKSWGLADQQTWGIIGAQTKRRLQMLLNLAETDEKDVVIIAHERNFGDNGTDISAPTVGAALSPSVAAWLNAACDYVCQTCIREQTRKKETKIAGKKATITVATGKMEYCLRIGPHHTFMTGFRLPMGAKLPDIIVNPTYAKIKKVIEGRW